MLQILTFRLPSARPTSPSRQNPPTTPSPPRPQPPRIPLPRFTPSEAEGLLQTSLGGRTFRSDIRPAKRPNYLSSPHPFAPSANACGDSCLRFVGVHAARCRSLRL